MSAILAAILDFSKVLFFAKLQQILLELVEKHVFLASKYENKWKWSQKEEFRTNFPPNFTIFLFWTLICIINYAWIISDDVIQLTSKDALNIRLQVVKVSFFCLKASNFRSEKPMGGPFDTPPPPLGRSRVKNYRSIREKQFVRRWKYLLSDVLIRWMLTK